MPTLDCEDANSIFVGVVIVADVGDEVRVGNRFVKILALVIVQDFEAGVWSIFCQNLKSEVWPIF